MFFLIKMARNFYLHPKDLGANLDDNLANKLIQEVEGSVSGRFGFVICVVDILNIGEGTIQEGSGMVRFHTEFTAIVFKPFKGEVLDAVQIFAAGEEGASRLVLC